MRSAGIARSPARQARRRPKQRGAAAARRRERTFRRGWTPIAKAERYILFESYLILDDARGPRRSPRRWRPRHRRGLRVCARLRLAGLARRCAAVGAVARRGRRDPRIQSCRDSTVRWRGCRATIASRSSSTARSAFVSGLCVDAGMGRRSREAARAVARHGRRNSRRRRRRTRSMRSSQVWNACGGQPLGDLPGHARYREAAGRRARPSRSPAFPAAAGRIVSTCWWPPSRASTLWLTDAYFVGTSAYTQALRAAAARRRRRAACWCPARRDIPALSPLSRAGYRPLLEAGVRVFEWNGTMLHAKTAVADGTWARVGSTNLNLASWMSNYELDVAIEDAAFAQAMASNTNRTSAAPPKSCSRRAIACGGRSHARAAAKEAGAPVARRAPVRQRGPGGGRRGQRR